MCEGTEYVNGTDCEGISMKVPIGVVVLCSPMLIPRQLRFSLYSGAVITEGLA